MKDAAKAMEMESLRVRVPKHIRLRYLRLVERDPDPERKEGSIVRAALETYAKQQEDFLRLPPMTRDEVAKYSAQLEQQKHTGTPKPIRLRRGKQN